MSDKRIGNEYSLRHGHCRPGRRTPEWNAYMNAKMRCNNPNDPRYYCYGARGIQFLFANFEEFIAATGPKQSGMVLDRINVDGNYESGNVRWVTRKESAKNCRITPLKLATAAKARAILAERRAACL